MDDKPYGTRRPARALKAVVIARRRESRLQQQLARTPLLASVGASDLRRLAAEGRERRYAEGDVVVYEGGVGGAFFIVLEGAACVSIDGVITRTLSTGDVFGEVALLQGVTRSATVVAATDLDCLLLTSWNLAGFLVAHEAVARTLSAQALRYVA
jgi:cAMP-binding proteins - catabolite gene activator and regulatory subunit of cAMP-dependent protein kinases